MTNPRKPIPDLANGTEEQAPTGSQVKTAFDVFGSDLADQAFAGVFDQPRQKGWREASL